jgi:hypothetical protein
MLMLTIHSDRKRMRQSCIYYTKNRRKATSQYFFEDGERKEKNGLRSFEQVF